MAEARQPVYHCRTQLNFVIKQADALLALDLDENAKICIEIPYRLVPVEHRVPGSPQHHLTLDLAQSEIRVIANFGEDLEIVDSSYEARLQINEDPHEPMQANGHSPASAHTDSMPPSPPDY